MSGSLFEFSVDLAEAQPPPPLPPGTYPFEIIGAQRRTSQVSGNTYVQVLCRIAAANYPADHIDGDPDGTVLSYNRLLLEDTPQARYRMRQFMERVGGPMGRTVDLNSLVGLSGMCEITNGEYEGEPQAQISKIIAP